MTTGIGMGLHGLGIGLQGDVPIVKAYLTREANGDKVLAESLYWQMRAMATTSRRAGMIFIAVGVPALIFFIGFLLLPAGIYMRYKAKKQLAIIDQAYAEWKAGNP
ncbi:MAG: hypothetical protein AAB654_19665 [Acidobacteriota bacterium]